MTVPTAPAALPAGHAQVERFLRRRMIAAIAVPAAVLAYLLYAAIAFDLAGLIDRARPERAAALAADLVSYKVVVTRDNRSGVTETAVEGERGSTYATPPDWVRSEGGTVRIDLADGYEAVYTPQAVHFTVPGYGTIRVTVSRAAGVEAELPPGPVPDWISLSSARFDAAHGWRRVIVTRAKAETHRFFWGWEEFFFSVNSPFHGLGPGELLSLALSDERIDPDRSNAGAMLDAFLGNPVWIHGEVFLAIFETILMAFLGTMAAALVALPLAFLSAATFAPGRGVRFGLRRLFDFLRGVDGLIWTIVLARAFGPGPMTGAFAIAMTDTGSFGKLFSEALENVDNRQIEGVQATGAGPLQRYGFGVLPQVMPVLLSQTLYMLESNTRSATVIGAIVGGGIGLLLTQAIGTQKDWENVAYYVVLIVLMVVAMDLVSGWLRRRLISGRGSG